MSKDLEDILYVLNGCESVKTQVVASRNKVRSYLSKEFSKLRNNPDYHELLNAHLSREARSRAEIITGRIEELREK